MTSLPREHDASSFGDQPLSPLDGRYRAAVAPLSDYLSEAGRNRARGEVEGEWLSALTDRSLFGTAPLEETQKERLRALYRGFGADEIAWLAEKESVTRHDVKAVEYLVRDRRSELGLEQIAELTHFACTSEDINSASYALTVQRAVVQVWLPRLRVVIDRLAALAHEHRDAPMLSRTHGQPATPTTMGKELAVFVWRLERVERQIAASEFLAKFSGATGTWSAHLAAEPDTAWPALSREFIESLGIGFNVLTTQIESHDWQVELYDRIRHAGGILHNLATDVWTYISLGYFSQIPVAGATGASTMPHKINPIRFENAEANLEISGGLLATLAQTLVTSRLQRDLTDSTTQRNIGVALGHSLLALDNLARGLTEISLAQAALDADLEGNWEVLAEAIQTVVRAEIVAGRSQISAPYALLKDLTRGRRVGVAELAEFVRGLDIGDAAKERLLALTPASYTGLASDLVSEIECAPAELQAVGAEEPPASRSSGAVADAASPSGSSSSSTGRSMVLVTCAGSIASSRSASATRVTTKVTPATMSATTKAFCTSSAGICWKNPIETSVTIPAKRAAAKASPKSWTGRMISRREGLSVMASSQPSLR